MSDRIVCLSYLTWKMTNEDYDEFREYFQIDEENKPVGGRNHIIGGLFNDFEGDSRSTDNNYNKGDADSSESDLESPYACAGPLQDLSFPELAFNVENADISRDELLQTEEIFNAEIAVERSRGQKCKDQGKIYQTV